VGREESLRQAIIAFHAGRKDEARRLLSRILETDPRDEEAWLWMSTVADTDEQRIRCLGQVLAINPDNAAAREGLALLQGDGPAPSAAPVPAAKGTQVRCPGCGFGNSPEAEVCSRCGEPLHPEVVPVPSSAPPSDGAASGAVPASEEAVRERRVTSSAVALLSLLLLSVCGLLLGGALLYPRLAAPPGEIVPPYADHVTMVPFEFRVIDAEYSKALDRIVMVSDEPAQLHIYDPATDTDTVVDLSAPPTGVSVGPDGKFAAVGHSRQISCVDLETAETTKSLETPTDVDDVFLGGDGWVYALVSRIHGATFDAVDMDTGNRVPNEQVILQEGTVYRLHPDGNSLYGVTETAPAELEKVIIFDGVPSTSYKSLYHGEYPMCDDLWLSEDGARIFTACGNVFRTSSNRGLDMAYAGSLGGLDHIRCLVHSPSAGLVLAVGSTGSSNRDASPVENRLAIFEYQYLTLDGVVTLPNLVVDGQPYSANGRFVFVNAAGTRYYVIVHAGPDSILADGFGLAKGDLPVEAAVAPGATMVPADQASHVPAATPQVPGALLSYQVIDAEYSLALDRIVMISDDPAQLHVYDPSTGSEATVDLSRSPSSVSVGPDGSFAAVGHDRKISYVDLKSARLVKTLNVTTDAWDVVLAGNGWVYASPRTGQWVRLRAVDLEANKEFDSTGLLVHAGSVYKLQPDGQSLYGAERRKSPADLQKLDIADGVPVHLYESPSHRGYPMGGDLWLSEDGQRIFTAGGTVLRTSSNPEDDMTYVGSLTNLERIRHLTHSSAAGLILAIPSKGSAADFPRFPSPGTNHVLIFGYENLDLQRTLTLPEYVVNGLPYDAIGRFVFANAAGTQYYVIVQAEEGAGLLQDYGVVSGEF
jgi:hypothetical protein